jgi:hypothetical protein
VVEVIVPMVNTGSVATVVAVMLVGREKMVQQTRVVAVVVAHTTIKMMVETVVPV